MIRAANLNQLLRGGEQTAWFFCDCTQRSFMLATYSGRFRPLGLGIVPPKTSLEWVQPEEFDKYLWTEGFGRLTLSGERMHPKAFGGDNDGSALGSALSRRQRCQSGSAT